jgi:hypothetical protein
LDFTHILLALINILTPTYFKTHWSENKTHILIFPPSLKKKKEKEKRKKKKKKTPQDFPVYSLNKKPSLPSLPPSYLSKIKSKQHTSLFCCFIINLTQTATPLLLYN